MADKWSVHCGRFIGVARRCSSITGSSVDLRAKHTHALQLSNVPTVGMAIKSRVVHRSVECWRNALTGN